MNEGIKESNAGTSLALAQTVVKLFQQNKTWPTMWSGSIANKSFFVRCAKY